VAYDWDKLKIPSRPIQRHPPDWNRLLSGGLAIVWIALCAIGAGFAGVLKGTLAIALPLACIWFPEALGSLSTTLPGPLSSTPIDRSSPAFLVRLLGWIVFLIVTFLPLILVATMR
jgi:hypothetical protein